ncbi:MAG TPA: hypothetical protein VMB03_25270 [Bryobacteraceae bacterium]|nr:hypothetical protein [Bryobacteraceae bacterium]
MSINRQGSIGLLLAGWVWAQASFEAAEVKVHGPKSTSIKGRILPGGRLEAGGMTLA